MRRGGGATSSTAHLISSVSILYIGGMTCTGMLMSLSESIRPTWVREDGARASSRTVRSARLEFALERRYSTRDLIERWSLRDRVNRPCFPFGKETDHVDVEIYDGEECVRIALSSIALDC